MRILDYILDIIYPKHEYCLYCHNQLSSLELKGLCLKCLRGIEFVNNYCLFCGRALPDAEAKLCRRCRVDQWYFSKARSIVIYKGVMRQLILEFKYNNYQVLKDPLSSLLALYYSEYYGDLPIDYIIPIPLHRERLQTRGYNQVALLAEGLKEKRHIPLLTSVLIRANPTQPLYDLGLKEREKIIKDSFIIKSPEIIKGKSILLLDDVITTGTTVNEASKVLIEDGQVRSVYVLTLATVVVEY